MNRTIKPREPGYLLPAMDRVERVFALWDSPEEGRTVRRLAEEIRSRNMICRSLNCWL